MTWPISQERDKHTDLNAKEREKKQDTGETNQDGADNQKCREKNKGRKCKERQTQQLQSKTDHNTLEMKNHNTGSKHRKTEKITGNNTNHDNICIMTAAKR